MRENIDTTGSPMPGRRGPGGEPIAGEEPGVFHQPEPPAEREPAAGDPAFAARREGAAGEPLAARERIAPRETGAAGAGAAAGGAAASRRRGWRPRRNPAATAVGTMGAGIVAIARLVMAIFSLIVLLIVLAIVLRDVDANASNTIIKGIHEGANFFAGAFTDLIKFKGHYKRAITINWGIAAIAYLLVGALISGVIRRIGRGGIRFERSHSAAPTH